MDQPNTQRLQRIQNSAMNATPSSISNAAIEGDKTKEPIGARFMEQAEAIHFWMPPDIPKGSAASAKWLQDTKHDYARNAQRRAKLHEQKLELERVLRQVIGKPEDGRMLDTYKKRLADCEIGVDEANEWLIEFRVRQIIYAKHAGKFYSNDEMSSEVRKRIANLESIVNRVNAPVAVGQASQPHEPNRQSQPARDIVTISQSFPTVPGPQTIPAHTDYFHKKSPDGHIVPREKLRELANLLTGGKTNQSEVMTPEFEEIMLHVGDDFVDDLLKKACKLAKIRGATEMEARDIIVVLERVYNMRIPGYSSDETRVIKRRT